MIDFQLSLDALGQTRFAYSPLGEVASSLRALGGDQVSSALHPWVRSISTNLTSIDFDVLQAAAPPGNIAPHFLYPWSTDPNTTIDHQLELLHDVPDEKIRQDLRVSWGSRPVTATAQELMAGGPAIRRRLISALAEYWEMAIQPHWFQIRAVLDDDVSYRARQVLAGGLYDLLSDLHPEVTLESGVLHVDKPHLPDASYDDAELILLPSVFVWPRLIVGQDTPGQFDMVYAARGVGRVWETDNSPDAGDALGALLGRTRAIILARLEVPLSTTQLSRQLGQSPPTISEHLSVLRRNGLLTSWRSGRSVLYRRTPLASSIIAFSESNPARSGTA